MFKVIFKYPLFLGVFLHYFVSFSQQTVPQFGVEQTIHFGSILPHRPLVNAVVEGHSLIYEFSFYKNTLGKKQWQQAYNYPKIGISAMILQLGNKEKLGNSYGVFPYIQFPISNKKIEWNIRFGYGLGYIEKPFDRETNFKNTVIGSTYNVLINLNSLWRIKLNENISTSAGISLVHFSNGSFTRPNLGINVFSLNAGLAYNFGLKKDLIQNEIPKREKNWSKIVLVNVGIKEIPPVEGPKYMVYTTSFSFQKAFSNKSSYGFSADLFYNSSLEQLISDEGNKTTSNSDNARVGLSVFYSLDVGKVSYLIQMGGYLRTAYDGDGFIYHRITSRYYINKNLFFNLGLKTHWAVADFIEFGIGYKFNSPSK